MYRAFTMLLLLATAATARAQQADVDAQRAQAEQADPAQASSSQVAADVSSAQPAGAAAASATAEPAPLVVPVPTWTPPGEIEWPPRAPHQANVFVPPLTDPTAEPPPPELTPPPTTALERSRLLLQVMPLFGVPLEGSFDRRLQARGYSTNEVFTGLDLTGQYRVLPWLWVGGRTGLRFRSFGEIDGVAASASGQDVLAITSARGLFWGFLDYWLELGAGVGFASTTMREVYDFALAPRLHASAGAGVNFLSNWRVVARVSFDWFPLFDVNALGDDTDLGGLGFGLGIEWRR